MFFSAGRSNFSTKVVPIKSLDSKEEHHVKYDFQARTQFAQNNETNRTVLHALIRTAVPQPAQMENVWICARWFRVKFPINSTIQNSTLATAVAMKSLVNGVCAAVLWILRKFFTIYILVGIKLPQFFEDILFSRTSSSGLYKADL